MDARTFATPEEKAWWKQFRAVVLKMPKSMEVLCNASGNLSAAARGALQNEFKTKGDADNVPIFCDCKPLNNCGFEDNSGSL